MKLIPIVEGHGETKAVPLLLRRILHGVHGLHALKIESPIRRHRDELASADRLKRWVKSARLDRECVAIVVLFDADDDSAAALRPALTEAVQQVANGLPVYVEIAVKEYEAWLLAGMDSLKGQGGLKAEPELPEGGPESVRDAKGWIRRNMADGRTYAETVDQEKLTALLNLELVHRNSPSFRELWRSMSDLVVRLGGSPTAPEWTKP